MANNKLFQELNLSHKPKRNGYDLSCKVNFTAKAGELLPIYHRTVMPGDNFRMKVSHFTRTAPLDTAAQTQIKEYFDFFFVPYRLLWKNAPQVHTNNTKNSVSALTPTTNLQVGTATPNFSLSAYFQRSSGTGLRQLCTLKNAFGYNRGIMSIKLMNHLGYGYVSNAQVKEYVEGTPSSVPFEATTVSAYPLLAYQCIYYNFFRNTQWEDNVPYNYNVDYLGTDASIALQASSATNYWNNPTMFDLQYANYPKDLFFGVFPDAQFGDESVVDISGSVDADAQSLPIQDVTGTALYASPNSTNTAQADIITSDSTSVDYGPIYAKLHSLAFDYSASFGILELRKAQFLQKYKEIIGSGNNDYKARIQKIFGVDIPDTLANIPQYLGGRSSDVKISDVDNTNLSDADSEALIKGKGTGSGESDTIEFEAKEHGIIMCIYHAQPVVDYSLTAYHFDVTKTEYDDYANPVFDQLGFQELPVWYLDLNVPGTYVDGSTTKTNYLGYTTRYFDYKTGVDVTLGDFRETQNTWLAPVNFDYLQNYLVDKKLAINANFFKVNPVILDPIFYLKADPDTDTGEGNYTSTDQLRVFSNLEIHAVRPLDYHGVPY